MTAARTFKLKMSERCFRFKPDALLPHAPRKPGVYEFVTFDKDMKPEVLFVGLAVPGQGETIYEAIAAHIEHGKMTPHISSSMHLHPINGAAQRVGADETAFGHRDKNFSPVVVGIWDDPADNEANIKWVRDYYDAIHPHSGTAGGYVNFMSDDDGHRAAANYGGNYDRLAAVKAAYDPDNLFHVNQNIVPAKGR